MVQHGRTIKVWLVDDLLHGQLVGQKGLIDVSLVMSLVAQTWLELVGG